METVIQSPERPGMGIGILVEIADGLSEAICAEPAIRSLKSQFGMSSQITVCSNHGDLFRNHPAVGRFGCVDPSLNRREYARSFRLNGRAESYAQKRNLVEYYAEMLGVNLMDRRPWICLDSFDTAEIQRFRLETLARPRIAMAIGDDEPGWVEDRDAWTQLHRLLTEQLHGSVIQIGTESAPIAAGGTNLSGRLTSRETAAVLMDCDVLICGDNGYLDLAASVQTPVVAILHPERLPFRFDGSWGTAMEAMYSESGQWKEGQPQRILQTAALYCRREHLFSRGIESA